MNIKNKDSLQKNFFQKLSTHSFYSNGYERGGIIPWFVAAAPYGAFDH